MKLTARRSPPGSRCVRLALVGDILDGRGPRARHGTIRRASGPDPRGRRSSAPRKISGRCASAETRGGAGIATSSRARMMLDGVLTSGEAARRSPHLRSDASARCRRVFAELADSWMLRQASCRSGVTTCRSRPTRPPPSRRRRTYALVRVRRGAGRRERRCAAELIALDRERSERDLVDALGEARTRRCSLREKTYRRVSVAGNLRPRPRRRRGASSTVTAAR